MAKKAVEKAVETVEILEVVRGQMEVCILGDAPLVHNRMSEKAKRQLLMPSGRKNAAEKAVTLKHNPMDEYRDSPYTLPDGPTLIGFPSAGFKKAMLDAALDMPGMRKSQIGRQVRVEGDYTPIYGTPELYMAVVRSADINRTPDIRTRAIMPKWACKIRITFARPLVTSQQILSLLAAAGITVGIGDGRQGKGSMSFGTFQIVAANDPQFLELCKNGGRKVQVDAISKPKFYDKDSEDLYLWYEQERKNRQLKGSAAA